MKNNNSSRIVSFSPFLSLFFSSKTLSFFSLITFLLFSVILSSCEKEPEPIEIGEEQLINTYYTDTMRVDVKVFQLDSINTTSRAGNSRLLMGSLTDDYVGKYSAQAYGNISLTTLTEDLRNDAGQIAIFDSLVGFFQTDYAYGDATAQNNIEIYEVSEFFETKSYYQFSTLQTSNSVIGTASYPADLDTNKVLRVSFAEEFGRQLFDYGINNKFENDSLFRRFSKGLAFKSTSPNTSIIGINPLAPTTNLTLYFHYPNDSVTSTYRFDMPLSFSNIESDLSNSNLSPLMTQDFVPTENTNNIAALQAGTGIAVKLEFPYLKSFVTDQSVVIQRVKLDIPILESATNATIPAPNQLLFFSGLGNGFYTPNGNIQFILREGSLTESLSMGYSIAGKSYSFANITTYINQQAKGIFSQGDGLIIQPSENNISVNRFIFPTQKNTDNLPAVRLRMYYSTAQ